MVKRRLNFMFISQANVWGKLLALPRLYWPRADGPSPIFVTAMALVGSETGAKITQVASHMDQIVMMSFVNDPFII